VATVVALPVTLCAGLLAFGWNIRIKFKIFGSGRVADVTLGVVLELHCTVFLAIQPDCKTLIIQFQQIAGWGYLPAF